jgi:hypothetical protein
VVGAAGFEPATWVDRGEFNSYALGGKTVYSEREVIDFLERVKARGPSRAPWRGNQTAASSERPKTISPKKLCLPGPIKSLISKW